MSLLQIESIVHAKFSDSSKLRFLWVDATFTCTTDWICNKDISTVYILDPLCLSNAMMAKTFLYLLSSKSAIFSGMNTILKKCHRLQKNKFLNGAQAEE